MVNLVRTFLNFIYSTLLVFYVLFGSIFSFMNAWHSYCMGMFFAKVNTYYSHGGMVLGPGVKQAD